MEDGVKSLRINSNDEVPYVVVNDSAEKWFLYEIHI
jgi:hypothetical protein